MVCFALFETVDGAKNVVVGIVCYLFLITPAAFMNSVQNKMRNDGRSVPKYIDVAFDITVTGLLFWHGWMVMGALYMIHSFLIYAAWDTALKQLEKK